MNAMSPAKPQLPHVIEAEQALIGAVMINNDAFCLVSSFLQAEHFFEPLHQRLWKLIAEQIETGQQANPVTLKPFIPADEKIGDITIFNYVVRLATEAVTVINARGYANVIADAATRRRLIALSEEISQRAFNASPTDPSASILTDIEAAIDDLRDTATDNLSNDSVALAVDTYLQTYSRQEKGKIIGLPLPEIQDVLSGELEAGNLYGLLSSSGEGKTSLILQVINHALMAGHPVLMLSYDQSKEQCAVQLVSQRLGLSAVRIREKQLTKDEAEKFVRDMMHIRNLPWEVKRCAREGTAQLGGYVRLFLRRHKSDKPALVVLDHARKVNPRDPKTHEGRIAAEINGFCKAQAVEHGLVWFNLLQRSSGWQRRGNPHPTSADLFGGEQAKEDYDAILYLYRPEKYRADRMSIAQTEKKRDEIVQYLEKWRDRVKIGALKVRFGDPAVSRLLKFEPEYTRYLSTRNEYDQSEFEGFL